MPRALPKKRAKDKPGKPAFHSGKLHRNDCVRCNKPLHAHDRERVYPEKGPSGSFHYKYICP